MALRWSSPSSNDAYTVQLVNVTLAVATGAQKLIVGGVIATTPSVMTVSASPLEMVDHDPNATRPRQTRNTANLHLRPGGLTS
jgi:hypothetical protein